MSDESIETALQKACERVRACDDPNPRDDFLIVGFEQGNKECEPGEWLVDLPATLDAIDRTYAAFDAFLVSGDLYRELEPTRPFRILLAVREALNSATTHGLKGSGDGEIALHAF